MINHFDIKWCLLHEGNKSVQNETIILLSSHHCWFKIKLLSPFVTIDYGKNNIIFLINTLVDCLNKSLSTRRDIDQLDLTFSLRNI